MSLIIHEMKIVEKKSKSTILSVQQTTDGEQPTKTRLRDISPAHTYGPRIIFPDW